MSKKGQLEKRNCENCKGEFLPKRNWQKFCKDQCRIEKWDENNPRVKKK
jgi:hypothetical protein